MVLALSPVSSAHQAPSLTSSSPVYPHSLVLSHPVTGIDPLHRRWPCMWTGNPTHFPGLWLLPLLEDYFTSSFSSNHLPHHSALMTSLPIFLRKQKQLQETCTDSTTSPSICVLLLTCPSSYHGPKSRVHSLCLLTGITCLPPPEFTSFTAVNGSFLLNIYKIFLDSTFPSSYCPIFSSL